MRTKKAADMTFQHAQEIRTTDPPETDTTVDSIPTREPEAMAAILFGEVFGATIQSDSYGEAIPAFRAFDLVRGQGFADHDEFLALCAKHGVPVVPQVFSWAVFTAGD